MIFFQKLIEVVNNIALLKTVKIKSTSNEWCDREIAEKLSIRVNYLKNSITPSQHRLGNLQNGKKSRPRNNQAEENSILKRNYQKI